MVKLSSKEIVDILKYDTDKAIIVEKNPIPGSAKFKAEYSVIDFRDKSKSVLTKNAYLLKKFGPAFKPISETIPNFVQCDAAVLYDRRILTIYPNGEAGIFDRDGELFWSGYFKYHDEAVCGLALEGKYFWCICHNENCAIRYSSQNMQIDLRIGGKDSSTFERPTHVSVDDRGDIFVCSGGNKVRKISGESFLVSDYLAFDESIKRFYKYEEYSIAVLSSGTYLIDNNEK